MINLDNEMGVLKSFNLHKRVVSRNFSNVKFFTDGRIKRVEDHKSTWDKYDIEFNVNPQSINKLQEYHIFLNDSLINIEYYDGSGDILNTFNFKASKGNISHNKLPFSFKILSTDIYDFNNKKIIKFYPFESIVDKYINLVDIVKAATDSDQLLLSLNYPNPKISEDYLNSLVYEFNRDGIIDRQEEYKRTIEFVDQRSQFIVDELEMIELRKQKFKEINNLSDLTSDANLSVSLQTSYDSELFEAQSQLDLVSILKDGTVNENDYELMPIDIGLKNTNINQLVGEFNLLLKERDRYLISAGPNNALIKNIEKQLSDYKNSISLSIDKFEKTLELNIKNLVAKEEEFANKFRNVPENEKILRAINRELEIKESLFLLLLQKREEASINFAVVKPSIKIIDNARSSNIAIFPKADRTLIVFSVLGIFIPFIILNIWFSFDNKVHTKKQILKKINIPIIGEIPYSTNQDEVKKIIEPSSRFPIAESIRMTIANLKLSSIKNDNNKNKAKVTLVTSSIKGEGKTLISTSLSSIISYAEKKKVLLIGADLRNPQIHKFLGVDKSINGLSDYIFRDDLDWKNLLLKNKNLDILLSGTIPPNPNALLTSEKFEKFINETRDLYDEIIIDSAPCLLVSDTLEISKYVDTTIYVIRSNFSEINLLNFIAECHSENKLSNINIVLNGVGNSAAYGYKYGYQYGYKYGYNYGYGYGYYEDKSLD